MGVNYARDLLYCARKYDGVTNFSCIIYVPLVGIKPPKVILFTSFLNNISNSKLGFLTCILLNLFDQRPNLTENWSSNHD